MLNTFVVFLQCQLCWIPIFCFRRIPHQLEDIVEDTAAWEALFGQSNAASGFLNLRSVIACHQTNQKAHASVSMWINFEKGNCEGMGQLALCTPQMLCCSFNHLPTTALTKRSTKEVIARPTYITFAGRDF